MTSNRWARLSRLYHEALPLQANDRRALLDRECRDNDTLRHEVESLLAAPANSFPPLPPVPPPMIGREIGPYVIVAPLGAGGMGEVYRATDTRLRRSVAIKILPAAFAGDADRLARFEREARLLATLNHPHIAGIYGIEDQDGITALVLELVEGETLADRIQRGPLPVPEALSIARQIAGALDAAHDKGIVHRDLKPGNIALSRDGAVKVLDFGLAKLADPPPSEASAASDLSSVAPEPTRPGIILGTPAYMSPEQARGRHVDRRTDIWAFGCVVFEMLSGQITFGGATLSDTIAAVLEREPDWTRLPTATPAAIRRLLRWCLEKDPTCRLRDIGDARPDLDASPVNDPKLSAIPANGHSRERLAWAIVGVLVAAVLVIALTTRTRPERVTPQVTRSTIALPVDLKLASRDREYPIAIAHDGSRLAFVGDHDGDLQLYVRELDSLESRLLPGTRGARQPFFSPDGESIGFFADGVLQKIAVQGGAPIRICAVSSPTYGGTWAPDGTMVFAASGVGLMKVSAAGGTPALLAAPPANWPDIILDGHTVLYTTGTRTETGWTANAVAVVGLDGRGGRVIARTSDSPLQGPPVLGAGATVLQARLTKTGYLIYGQSPGSVRSVRFDLAALSPTGAATAMLDRVERARNAGAVYFAVSDDGLLLIAPTGEEHQLVWVDRSGVIAPISDDRRGFREAHLSPDDTRISVAVSDDTRRADIWVYDAVNGTKRRVTKEHHNLAPVWKPDGSHLTISSDGEITEWRADGSGAPAVLLVAPGIFYPRAWSPDSRTLLLFADTPKGDQLWLWRRGDAGPSPLLSGPFNASQAVFSPDGGWIAYVSDESGRDEVYVGRFPDLRDATAVSTEGGAYPRWSHDGRELFFRHGDAMMAVTVKTSPTFRAQKPHRLFAGDFSGESHDASFDVTANGQRFVMVKSDERSTLRQLTVVHNWFEELTRRAP